MTPEKVPARVIHLPVQIPIEGLTVESPIEILSDQSGKVVTTLDGRLQKGLQDFLTRNYNPIASVVVVDAVTGHVLALVQGRDPRKWGSSVHTALYTGFPAASVFKIVPAAAALQVASVNPQAITGLTGGCANVNPKGVWLRNTPPHKHQMISLERAFAFSCNSFFAKLAVQQVGMGLIQKYAERFGWGASIPADFFIPESPIHIPEAASSDIQTVGRFAAGFGTVGLSAVHAAWLNLAIANDGKPMPLRIFARDGFSPLTAARENFFDEETSHKMRLMMHKTVSYGTARGTFRKRRYRKLVEHVGGKTGSLTVHTPQGRITWFAGLMPIDKPEVIVSSVVLNDGNKWHIRGPDLAAEALWLWFQQRNYQFEKDRLESITKLDPDNPERLVQKVKF